ncbi:protein tudor isoform X1 [Megachile rotundata]|uniref:protein tudor isoform X1 n=1 Tax=Megachile rotundata TaxID=143995 RepID=UPI003FD6AC58
MSVQQSTELIIFVTHIEAEDSFLKIWGQVDKNSATCVERMILPLVEHFIRSQGCVGPLAANLHINALCCAKFQNEGYYRARVINIRSDGMVVLQFIDYGNIEVLPPQEVHLLDTIPGSESLQSLPPVALDFTLMHVLPVNGIWENKIIESIKKTLRYNEYKILFHSMVNNHRFIKLWCNNEDFSELLIKRHMAIRASLQDMFRLKCVQQPQVPIYQPSKHSLSSNCATMTPVENMNALRCDGSEMHGYQSNVPLCCLAQQKQMMQTSVQEALVFKSRVLDVPSKHDVYVSCVEDGPHKFSVQLRSAKQILSSLMREINSHPIEPLQEPPLPGSVCLGRYTQDKVLCRAVVMSVMENKCKLYYVDFGHTEMLPYTDIFQLPPHFINPRVLSIRFTLSGVYELNTTEEMKEYFKKIVSHKPLVLHVRPPEGPPLVQYGDLYDEGKNIKDILRQAFPSPTVMTPSSPTFTYQEAKKLLKGTEENVLVSFVESCKKFFVQSEKSIKSLELIMTHLAEFCKSAPNLNLAQLKIGFPCAALYDHQWYRAQIIAINSNNVKVLYVDYGNEETVPLTSLRYIREDLVKKLQAQAIKCILNGWELLPCTQEVYNQFELLILEKRLSLRVVDVTMDGIIVDLYDPEKMQDVKSEMLHLIGDEKKVINELSYNAMEEKHSVKMSSKINQSESTNKWHEKKQSDSWHQKSNNNIAQEKNKFKSWKDESNEGKLNDNKSDKNNFHRNDTRNESSFHRNDTRNESNFHRNDTRNESNFHRNDTRNEKFNRDDYANNRNSKDKWSNKNEYNESSRSGRSPRGGGRKTSSGYGFRNSSSDKSWSDKDSDTSSRGSGRRGRSSTRGGYAKREGISGRLQSNKFNDKENDGNFKGGRTNNDFYRGNSRSRDKKGQGYRLTQSKFNSSSSFSDGEGRRYSPMRNKSGFHIPSPNIVVGSTKTCEVVFTTNLSDFFIQLSPDYTALDSLMENIASIYENGGELMKESEISRGAYCVAQYSVDLKWYRALIKSVEGKTATVQFVDYGNTENVEFDKIKAIKEEFVKLPVQAVHCKLFGVKNDALDKSKVKDFEDKVAEKTLEIEFVVEENGIYSVLLREVVNGFPSNTFINEEFCEGIDLLKTKMDAILSGKTSASTKQLNLPDYVSCDAKWATISDILEAKKDVIITWFTNPNNFYCQVLDNEKEFRIMMNEIQKIYAGREPVSHTLQIGSPVIAIFSEDGALYRAEIIELNKLNGHLVQYIDFGNNAVVDPRKIYSVEKKLMQLPKQAIHCSLLNIIPQDGLSWSKVNTTEIDNCFNADKFECVFHDIKDDKYVISLSNNGNDVATTLVQKNIASFASESKSDTIAKVDDTATPEILCNVERIDINLLSGQVLRVKVSSVENASKFYIQFPAASECENQINNYMANKDPKVMQRLAAHEICLGTGCLVYSNGVWRRAVISNHSRTAGFDVKFIDTGAYDEILSDSVLALPGELSVMQNQAIECSLANISSPETDKILKERIEGKEVLVQVNEVDNNRLIVKVFDLFGNKINISEDSDEKICPICPMPILSSTYKVAVSYADHSASIWLQRNEEYYLDKTLAEALDQYYSTSGKLVEPKVDLLCAAKSVDGHWYRAKVITCTENGVYVNFIDYGNNEEVTPDVLMTLDSQFYTPHQLAINVSLPVTLNGPISEQLNILQNYLSHKELTAVFRNVNNKWVVELLQDGEKISDKFRSLNLASEKTSSVGKPRIHHMSVGSMYNVLVSHSDSPSQFWLQHKDDIADLESKQEELQIQAPTFPLVDGILEEGSLCVAVYSIDNLWYRAQVLDADEDITTVRFIDYGNTDIIDSKPGNIRQIPDSWKELKEYAIKCRLDVISIDSEDWNVTTCEKFGNLVTSADSLQALIIANSIPKRVDLLVNGKSVNETLVEEHHAIKVHTEEELIDEIVDLELDPHSAFVSHVNSPSEFWVQEEKSVGDLEVMSDRFIVAHMFPKVDEIKENLLCIAKYPEDDCWYRARVVSHNDNATRVIYIDYGNSATSTEIRAIPPDLANVPPLSRKCSLVMPQGITEWSQKACEEFVRLAADGATIFLLDVLKEDETSLVKLTLNGNNVTDLLANFCERYPPIIEERLPPLGEENSPNVFITRVNSPNDFWVQTESSITDLSIMADRLQAAHSFLPLNTFETGTICAAQFSEDNQWYRAKILSHSENGTEVLYIDFGNKDITNEVRVLPVDIINIPPLSKHCALQKLNTISDWPPEVCKTFEELVANGETMFQFEILDDTNDPIYVKLTLNGTNIIDLLVPDSKTANEEDISKEEKDEIYCSPKTDTNIDMPSEMSETFESANNFEDEKQEMDENADKSANMNSTIELSIDEIVQNMKSEEEEEETLESNANNLETCENIDIKEKTNLEQVESQAENETQKPDINIGINNDSQIQKTSEEEISSDVSNTSSLTTKIDLKNLEEEQNNSFNSKTESEKEISEDNTDIQCSKLNEENKVELESENKLPVTNDKEEICELNTNVQNRLDEEKTAELESKSKPPVISDNEEKCELGTDIQASKLDEKIELVSESRESVTSDNKEEMCELNTDTQCSNLNEENTTELQSTSKQFVTSDVDEKTINMDKTVTQEQENDSENCKIQGDNKVNVSTTDPKDCSEIKTDKMDKNECLNVQPIELANNESSKITDKQDTISLCESSVSMNVNEGNNTENVSHSEENWVNDSIQK